MMTCQLYSARFYWASYFVEKMVAVELTIAALIWSAGAGIFFSLWIGTAGIMLVPIAGIFRLSGHVARHFGRRTFCAPKARSIFTRQPVLRARTGRAYRRTSRPTFSGSSGNSPDSGESDQGDPPGPLLLPVTPTLFQTSRKKSKSLPRPWHCLGYCRVPCRNHVVRGWAE